MDYGLALVPLLVAVIFMVVGGTFVVRGRRLRQTSKRFLATSVTTQAVVLDLRYRPSRSRNSNRGVYHPVLRYVLPDGRIVEAEASFGSSPAPARAGEVVPVRYDPQDPTNVELADGLVGGGSIGVFFIVFGMLFFSIGAVSLGVTILLAIYVDLP